MRSAFSSQLTATVSLFAITLFAAPAAAQVTDEAANLPGSDAASAEELIVVTGSRIRRPDFTSPNPVISLDAASMQQSGTTNLTDFLTGYPALAGSSTSGQNSGSGAGIGYTGLNLLNLRNLGTDRTLVLVDGRRHVSGVPGSQAIDINTIPTDLVERVEVLTGGASAIYGADGVSGVVNFILKKDFEGIAARVQAGISEHGDSGQRLGAITVGKNFADGRGNVALAYEFGEDDRLELRDRRDYRGARRVGFYRNPDYTPNTPGSYLYIPQNDVRYTDTARGGAVDVNEDFVSDFLGDGTPYDYGQAVPGGYQRGGNATSVADYGNDVRPSVRRHVVNAIGHFDVSDKVTLFAEGKYANIRSFSLAQPTFDYYLFLPQDNPFIPANVAAAIDPAVGGVLVNRDNFDFGQRGEDIERETIRTVFGARGDLSDALRYELSYVYGQTKVKSHYVNDIYDDRFLAAIDAVRDPATGNVTCRVNVDPTWAPYQPYSDYGTRDIFNRTTFGVGECVPLNIFGEGVASSDALAFISRDTVDRSKIEQQVLSGVVSGDLRNFVSLPGGEIGFAVGGEYRREKSTFTPDPIAAQGLTFTNALAADSGKFSVKEVFGEVDLPLLADVPFAHALEVGGAIRYSDYSTIGSTTTWKLNGAYAPVRDVRFRGTYSKAVRAPNIGELFGGASQTFAFFDDPCITTNLDLGTSTRAANCAALLGGLGVANPAAFDDPRTTNLSGTQGGNRNLREETATSWTVGAVVQPSFLPGLDISVDWYDITLKNAINTVDAQELAELCVDQPTLDNPFCSSITRQNGGANAGLITGFTVQPQNVANFKTSGLELNVNYRFDAGEIGKFSLRAIANYLNELEFVGTPGADATDYLQSPDYTAPKYQANMDLTWNKGPFTLNYGLSWFDKQLRFNRLSVEGNPNYVAPEYKWIKERWVHDFYGSVDVSEQFQFYAGVNNMFGQKPDLGSAVRPVDVVGRFFYAGARVKLPSF